jgi:hypothetical protein
MKLNPFGCPKQTGAGRRLQSRVVEYDYDGRAHRVCVVDLGCRRSRHASRDALQWLRAHRPRSFIKTRSIDTPAVVADFVRQSRSPASRNASGGVRRDEFSRYSVVDPV